MVASSLAAQQIPRRQRRKRPLSLNYRDSDQTRIPDGIAS